MVWEKGKSGNPAGRPAGRHKPWRAALDMALKRRDEKLGGPDRALQQIAENVLDKAEAGDKDAWREVAERLDGKVAQALVGDADHDPIQVQGMTITIVDPKVEE